MIDAGMPPRRILLVEDDPGLVRTLTDRLRSEGYEIETAVDGDTGLDSPRAPDISTWSSWMSCCPGETASKCARAQGTGFRYARHHAHRERPHRRQGLRA